MKLKSTIGSKYQLVRNSDGTFNVLQVPIFKLGNSKGFDYTSQWFEKLKLNHKRMERETGYKPTFFIGHNSYNRGEAPALGYIQNLTLDGNTVKADLCNFKENTFDIFIP